MNQQECGEVQHRIQQGERVYIRHPTYGCGLVRLVDALYQQRGWISFVFGFSGGWQCFADEVEITEPTEEEKQTISV